MSEHLFDMIKEFLNLFTILLSRVCVRVIHVCSHEENQIKCFKAIKTLTKAKLRVSTGLLRTKKLKLELEINIYK